MKTQYDFLTSINTTLGLFGGNINFDATEAKYDSDVPHISLKYLASNLGNITIGKSKYGGTLRIFIFDISSRDNYNKSDELIQFLDENYFDDIKYTLSDYIQSPTRLEAGKLYSSIIEFSLESCEVD